jgi:hypothetical protein
MATLGTLGCGASLANSNCPSTIPLVLSPANATADHTAAPPGNQVSFGASAPSAGVGCAVNDAIATPPDCSVSDTTDVSVAETTGVATCLHATSEAVTVSDKIQIGVQRVSGSTMLTCK